MAEDQARPVFVSGLSGAGMSSALKQLEDFGYEAFDNFPLSLAEALVQDPLARSRRVAIGIDTRSRGFDPDALLAMAARLDAELIFLTADEAVLLKRFTETRRRHPLALDRPVSAGIRREIEWLYKLRQHAQTVIDTSDLSIHDLRRVLEKSHDRTVRGHMTVTIMSFAFRHGLPREADMVFDTRFLRNPHWDAGLRPLTGTDPTVQAYVMQDDAFTPFTTHLQTLLEPLLPRYAAEGKSYLTLAFGCTGGKHRSVTLAEIFRPWVERQGYATSIAHRDVNRQPN